ncbi:MAG: PAS domain S-box protein, partial [bacterium]
MKVKAKLRIEILVVLVVIGSLLVLGGTGFDILSGLRAYVGGEGLWAKGQKEATYQLIRYVYSGDEAQYHGFLESLAVPLGDRTARLELDAPESRREVIVQGLLAGGNHPDDIPTMITLYRLFQGIGHVKKAVGQWAIGDGLIAELADLGEEIHVLVAAGGLDQVTRDEYCNRIDALQRDLNEAETRFSYHIAVASRQATGLLIAVMITFSVIGGIICFIMLRLVGGIIKELGHSEARFRRLAENAPDVIYRMALPGGNYDYMSPAAEAVFGFPPETFYMKPRLISEIMHPDWRDYFTTQWENLLAGEMPHFYEYQIIHGSGETRWLNQRNVLIQDEAGQPIAIEGIVTDITEVKAWEAEREQLSQELRQAHKMEAIGTLAGGIA